MFRLLVESISEIFVVFPQIGKHWLRGWQWLPTIVVLYITTGPGLNSIIGQTNYSKDFISFNCNFSSILMFPYCSLIHSRNVFKYPMICDLVQTIQIKKSCRTLLLFHDVLMEVLLFCLVGCSFVVSMACSLYCTQCNTASTSIILYVQQISWVLF